MMVKCLVKAICPFELLGNLGVLNEEGDGGNAVQVNGKYGSYDRQRMPLKSSGFNFELTLVFTAAAAVEK